MLWLIGGLLAVALAGAVGLVLLFVAQMIGVAMYPALAVIVYTVKGVATRLRQ